uniref:Uncharacterized protein n=1 Tax=Cacopsylla melanoneura TaxID=428564 RepID=A0A8D9BID7_9HEMI
MFTYFYLFFFHPLKILFLSLLFPSPSILPLLIFIFSSWKSFSFHHFFLIFFSAKNLSLFFVPLTALSMPSKFPSTFLSPYFSPTPFSFWFLIPRLIHFLFLPLFSPLSRDIIKNALCLKLTPPLGKEKTSMNIVVV